MASFPRSGHPFYKNNNKEVTQGCAAQSQHSSEFLDNPFRSLASTIAFIILCAFVVTSIYILLKRYGQLQHYKFSASCARPVPNLESARALSSGIDTGQSWTLQAESGLTTADLVDMRDGTITSDGDFSPIGMFSYEGTETHRGHTADCEVEGGMVGGTLEDENIQEQYYTPANAVFGETELMRSARKRAGEELDRVRRNFRSRTIRPNRVVVGQVGDSRIAQRRRSTSNRSM